MTEDSTVNFDGGAAEPLTEGQGESSHKRRREEPRLNIKNLRPWDKGILLQELVADRDEREAQRRARPDVNVVPNPRWMKMRRIGTPGTTFVPRRS